VKEKLKKNYDKQN